MVTLNFVGTGLRDHPLRVYRLDPPDAVTQVSTTSHSMTLELQRTPVHEFVVLAYGVAAGGRCPLPCLTTALHLPASTIWRLGPLLRTSERRPSILEARCGLRSSPPAGPRLRTFHPLFHH